MSVLLFSHEFNFSSCIAHFASLSSTSVGTVPSSYDELEELLDRDEDLLEPDDRLKSEEVERDDDARPVVQCGQH